MHEVGRLYLKGFDPNEIARELGLQRKEVLRLHREWQEWARVMAKQSGDIRDLMVDVLQEVNQHYAMIMKEAWATAEEAGLNGMLAVKVQALKLTQTTQKDRAQLALEMGASANNELADKLLQQEQEAEVLKAIFRDVTSECPVCGPEVRHRLAGINTEAEVVSIEVGEPSDS